MDDDDTILTARQRTGSIALGLALAAFGLFWMAAASRIPARTAFSSIAPGLVPFWAGALLTLMGVAVAVAYWRRPANAGPDALVALDGRAMLRAGAMVLVLFVYILVLVRVHALIAAFALSLAGLAIAGEPLRWRLPLLAAAIAGVFFAVFIWWLDVPLPGSRYF